MRFKSRTRAMAVAALAASVSLAGLTTVATPAGAAPAETDRVAGTTRYGTAAEAATRAYPTGADTVVITTGEKVPDALSANPIAGEVDGPILLVQQNAVPVETQAALAELSPENIIIVGGTEAVSAGVEAGLEAAGFTVDREAGTDRFKTAAEVARAVGEAPAIDADGAGAGTPQPTVAIANGLSGLADAVSASPMLHQEEIPLLLTSGNTLNADSAAVIDELNATQVILLGGTAAIPASVETALEGQGINVVRLGGADRFATAGIIADFEIDFLGFDAARTFLANGFAPAPRNPNDLVDALSGGPLASVENGPILLVTRDALTAPTEAWLEANAADVDEVVAIGGTAVISDAVLTAAAAAADEAAGGQGGVITLVDTANNTYRYTAADGTQVTVVYDATNDVFTIDGNPASLAAFEGALSVGDTIVFVDDPATAATDADQHNLTNRTAASYTSGTVGNVNTALDDLYIIDAASGVVLSDVKDYAGGIYYIDGVVANLAAFEGALNEGDTVVIETDAANNKTFRLTNGTVSGAVTVVDATTDQVRVGNLGDDPLSAQDADYDYVAGSTTNNYFVGGVAATLAQFEAALTVGDTLEVTRTGDTQTFRLTNVAPPAQSGVLTDVFDITANTATLANGATDVLIDYSTCSVFRVGGAVVTEDEFEAQLTEGDTINFQPDNPDTTTVDECSISLTNGTLQGNLRDADATNNTFDVENAAANIIVDDLDYTTAYFGGTARYFVNGVEVTQAQFDAYIAKVEADTTPEETVVVEDVNTGAGDDLSTNYRLTTDETI